ncbi:hypothetical protein KCU90_g3312, partial [Aureobasidium melanogenum]
MPVISSDQRRQLSSGTSSLATLRKRIEPRPHSRDELRNALAAMRTRVFEIGRPVVEQRTIDRVPALLLPIAEVHFLQTIIMAERTTEIVRHGGGERRAAHQRTRYEHPWRRHLQRGKFQRKRG